MSFVEILFALVLAALAGWLLLGTFRLRASRRAKAAAGPDFAYLAFAALFVVGPFALLVGVSDTVTWSVGWLPVVLAVVVVLTFAGGLKVDDAPSTKQGLRHDAAEVAEQDADRVARVSLYSWVLAVLVLLAVVVGSFV